MTKGQIMLETRMHDRGQGFLILCHSLPVWHLIVCLASLNRSSHTGFKSTPTLELRNYKDTCCTGLLQRLSSQKTSPSDQHIVSPP